MDNNGSQSLVFLIDGVDTSKGIAMTGGTLSGYRQVLSMFRMDAENRLQLLKYYLVEAVLGGGSKFPKKHLSSFVTQVHALKSACGSLGAMEVSSEAARLEDAGRDEDLVFIQKNLPAFTEHLERLSKNVQAALEQFSDNASFTDFSAYIPLFLELAAALTSQHIVKIDKALDELHKKPADANIREILAKISDQILVAEFDSAVKTINELIASNK